MNFIHFEKATKMLKNHPLWIGKTKGQLSSESIYEVFVSPKIQTTNCLCSEGRNPDSILGETMTS